MVKDYRPEHSLIYGISKNMDSFFDSFHRYARNRYNYISKGNRSERGIIIYEIMKNIKINN